MKPNRATKGKKKAQQLNTMEMFLKKCQIRYATAMGTLMNSRYHIRKDNITLFWGDFFRESLNR